MEVEDPSVMGGGGKPVKGYFVTRTRAFLLLLLFFFLLIFIAVIIGLWSSYAKVNNGALPCAAFISVLGSCHNWILIQRNDYTVKGTFKNKMWNDYKWGFGVSNENSAEFWLGLGVIHALTSCGGSWTLRIRLKWWKYSGSGRLEPRAGTYGVAEWSNFRVGSEADKYRLGIGRKSRSENFPSDPFHPPFNGSDLDGMAFTTSDADNDRRSGVNCAINAYLEEAGGWWYNSCAHICLNTRTDSVVVSSDNVWRHPSESTMWIRRN